MSENHLNCTCSYCGNKIHKMPSHIKPIVFCNNACKFAYQKGRPKSLYIDLTGQRFGKLTVLEFSGVRGIGRVWKCLCDCGNVSSVPTAQLRNGNTKSCGCSIGKHHGLYDVPEYEIWVGMKMRCYNPRHTAYKNYGGRGIKVCNRWLENFKNFYDDLGKRPSSELTLERIDNNGDYSPDNCKWATRKAQSRNTRKTKFLTLNGETLSVAEWLERLGINRSSLRKRLERWPLERALTEPPRRW